MYLLSSVGRRVSHSENTSPNPVGAPDAIRGGPGAPVRGSEPHSPLLSSCLSCSPTLPPPPAGGGGGPGLQPLPWTLTHWPCGSCPFSLVGSPFQKSGGLFSRGGKEVCCGALWAHSGLGDPQGMVSPIAAWRGGEKKGG